MTTYYVRSTDGNNADDGLTWATAKADLQTPTWAAGDTIYVSDNHAQTTAAGITIATGGTLVSPTKVICVDDAAEPPTAVAEGATVTTTGSSSLTVDGHAYVYGLSFKASTGSNADHIRMAASAAASVAMERCDFDLSGNTGTSAAINIHNSSSPQIGSRIAWKDCDVKFGNTGQAISIENVEFQWNGGSILAGSAAIVALFEAIGANGNRGTVILVSGVDLSNAAQGLDIFATGNGIAEGTIRNCKLPASWNGDLCVGTPAVGRRYRMHDCSAGDVNYAMWEEDYCGSIKHDTAVYNDAGATDGTTRLSWKMTSGANAEYPLHILRSPEIVRWNETVGSAITVTVEVVHNSQGAGTNGALQDDETWLEVQYLGTSGYPLGSFVSDCKASVLAAAADQATSSAAWTGDAAGWDTQALSVTFTPQEKGYLHAVVCVGKASKTVYVDPLLTVS